jgi:hypothetical protein
MEHTCWLKSKQKFFMGVFIECYAIHAVSERPKEKQMTIDADYIRKYAADHYIKPARNRGESRISIPVGKIEADLRKVGLETGRTPAVCSALRGRKFQKEYEVFLDHFDGPPSGQSTTVVFHYLLPAKKGPGANGQPGIPTEPKETSEEWAKRLTDKLKGLLKDELAEYGGGEAFLKWMRSEDDEERAV